MVTENRSPSAMLLVPAPGEASVLGVAASDTRQDSAWRLLVELSASGGPGSDHQVMESVGGAVHSLGLQPAQVERILKAVMESIPEAKELGSQDQHGLPVIVRLWTSRAISEDPSISNQRAKPDRDERCRGWGFFVVRKHADGVRVSSAEACDTIELYLYQERALSKRELIVKKE